MSRNAPLVPGLIAMCPSACLAVRACDDYDLRTLLHGPRHDTGNAVPESNLKSRVGCRRAVARRADNQARAMAAIAVGEREEWAAPQRVKPVHSGVPYVQLSRIWFPPWYPRQLCAAVCEAGQLIGTALLVGGSVRAFDGCSRSILPIAMPESSAVHAAGFNRCNFSDRLNPERHCLAVRLRPER